MSKKSIEEQALTQAISNISSSSSKTLAPGPGTGSRTSTPKPAIRRCCAAWQRAFDAYMANCESTDDVADIFAVGPAGQAYRNAMPMLTGLDGIRDFVACAAHGILIGAIPENKAGQLLYAAQVALATLRREPKPPETPVQTTPLPPINALP